MSNQSAILLALGLVSVGALAFFLVRSFLFRKQTQKPVQINDPKKTFDSLK